MTVKPNIDLVLTNGNIITMSPEIGIAEGIAIQGDKVVQVGARPAIDAIIGPDTTVIDLGGKTVTPGFIESHCHPSKAGTTLAFEVIVKGATSIGDIITLLKTKAQEIPKGNWVIGKNYNDQQLVEKRHPNRWDLDEASRDHPILLYRLDGHVVAANTMALELSKITAKTPDPEGGKIVKAATSGEPTGLLLENAQNLVKQAVPPYSVADLKQGIIAACQKLAQWGVTSFTDANVDHDSLVAYQELAEENKLPLRVNFLLPWFPVLGLEGYAHELEKVRLAAGFGSNRLKFGGTKFMADGSMSGKTAALYHPYEGDSGNLGIMTISEEKLTRGVVAAHRIGARPCIHAIGDRAIDITLNAIQAALKARPVTDHRMRIEHCSLPSAKAIERIRHLGVMPSSAVGFIYELGSTHLAVMGTERMKHYFPHKTYIEKEIVSIGHSDWMVTEANMVRQIYSAVARKSFLGEPIASEQAISVMEALRLYTINAAYAEFGENIKGSIEPGKLADLTILDQDISTIPVEQIKNVKIEKTIVGGKIVYQRNDTSPDR
jgi:predicted amidohydrolase YtcJ